MMTINTGNTPEVNAANVDRSSGSAAVDNSSVPQTVVPPNPITVDDHIALSVATNVVQQASSIGSEMRLARVQQLKTAIQTNQYVIDPKAVSHALIESELLGRS
jgi:flagellar biosynthesis anti-sigma factor FlgM